MRALFGWNLPVTGMLFLVLGLAGCQREAPAPPTDLTLFVSDTVPEDPADPAWDSVPEFYASLLLQDLVDPRQMSPTTPELRVRAVTDGIYAAFRLQWPDGTSDDSGRLSHFYDACAVQLPAAFEPTVPAPQMGEPGRPVQITYWSAAWQARVDGRGDSIRDIYPHAAVDHYPFDAPPLQADPAGQRDFAARYAPAVALGNPMSGPRSSPVQDLVAEGPGTLAPATHSLSRGSGIRVEGGWAVVIVRPLPAGLENMAQGHVAFAVWDGAHEEVGARKMRTAWLPLLGHNK